MIKLSLDRDGDNPLYVQIREEIRKQIDQRQLSVGDKLPTVSQFAKEIGVTQATIRRAYEDLIKEGLLGSHVGRGTFVCDPSRSLSPKPVKETSGVSRNMNLVDSEFLLAARRLRMGIAKNLDDLMILAQRPGLISFTSGIPDPAFIEEGVLQRLALDALKNGQMPYQGYGENLGMFELRKEIARRYSEPGCKITPDQVLITNGSQQGVSVLAQAALESGQRVICETPCYMGIPRAFGAIGHWVESVPRDKDGPIPERLYRLGDNRQTLFYTCPELHNPMGTDISSSRQKVIVDWAQENRAIIIADQIFHDIRFEESSPTSFLSELGPEQTVVIGSLSKSYMCGLRVGWMISSQERIQSIVSLKRAMDISSPPLMQGIALSLLKSGIYDDHLVKVRQYYQERCATLLDALKKYMPEGITWTEPKGGFHMWLDLPKGYSSIVLFLLAIEKGVAIAPGPTMDVDHRFVNGFRLSYAPLSLKEIREGVELLSAAVVKLLKESPSEPGLSGLGDF
ncbi:PLP-dependent aminotransferase family protein [bacterium]|nr:PLP-dependent aminotransferase family protein [bacterium]